jgi:hypothetical protein
MVDKTADQVGTQKRGKAAINCFPKVQIINALAALADGTGAKSQADADSASASLDLTIIAAAYGVEAHEIANGDTSTVLGDWRENLKQVALELAANGSPFAESRETDTGTVAKLTGTGNNVMSIAKGVVDFRVEIADCINEQGEVSYRQVRATVEAKRAERRAEQNPDAAALAEAKEDAREAWQSLSKLIFATDDMELIEALTSSLEEMEQGEVEAQAEQDAAEADEQGDEVVAA